jgi:hypothetical protein
MESRLQIPEPRPMRPVFREALKRRLSQSSSHVGRTWRFSFPVGLVIISAVFGGAVATAAIYEQFRPVSNLNSAHCFSIASSETSGTQIAEAGPLTSPQQVTDAVGACSVLWRDVFLVLGTSNSTSSGVHDARRHRRGLSWETDPLQKAGVATGQSMTGPVYWHDSKVEIMRWLGGPRKVSHIAVK